MSPARSLRHSRVPITITLSPGTYDFVESCAARREFRSLDDFFEAALAIFGHHLEALTQYIELQETKGLTLDEIKSSTQYEIVFTHRKD